MFGRERFGLFNEEVALADEIVTFPVNPEFASLNIAQAVLLMSYEWMKSGLESETDTAFSGPEIQPAEKDTSARTARSSGTGARRARLFPAGGEEAEDGRQSARGADPSGFHRGGDQGVARRRRLARLFLAEGSRAANGYPERKAEADREAHADGDYRRKPAPRKRSADDD